ncbi:MAG TPA: thiamine pyrophosphate-dependent enzyme, partial [Arthrobacter sp.]
RADWHGTPPETVVKETLAKVKARLESQDLGKELKFMADIREAVPSSMQTFWDMTISAYWAWSCWDAREGQFHSAQGAGGLGFGFPAAIGGAVGLETTGKSGASARVLAVSGDGSSMYSISELATAKQHNVPVTWLIVDDGGYGILREYMVGAFGKATATELARPDFVKLAEAFGVPAVRVAPEDVGDALKAGFAADGPNVVVVETLLRMFAPTHVEP